MNKHHAAIAYARRHYADPSNDDIEIDDTPAVCESEDGYWIAAWVYVRNEDIADSIAAAVAATAPS